MDSAAAVSAVLERPTVLPYFSPSAGRLHKGRVHWGCLDCSESNSCNLLNITEKLAGGTCIKPGGSAVDSGTGGAASLEVLNIVALCWDSWDSENYRSESI